MTPRCPPVALRVLICAAVLAGCAAEPASDAGERWWKGNLHTHSLWSDGEDFPEMIAAWYRDRGYHFVAFTEHDMLQEGEQWVDIAADDEGWPPRRESTRRALPAYRARFGDLLEERHTDGRHLVRLRALNEYRDRFEQPGRFLLLTGEEITDREGAHINAFHLRTAVLPAGGADPAARTRRNLASLAAARDAAGRPVTAIVNHPNYLWALTAEELADIPEVRHFELFNGHLHVNNQGDAVRAGTERMWDIMLALRHAHGGAPIFGVATDDAHHYREFSDSVARPGRGWIMVRAERLEAAALLDAIEAGDFYASTGVTLEEVRADGRALHIRIAPEAGVSYRTQFIGTLGGRPVAGEPVTGPAGDTVPTTRRYPSWVGAVLAEVEGTTAVYAFRGDEMYVRAKVVASVPRSDAITRRALGPAAAWTQPVAVARSAAARPPRP